MVTLEDVRDVPSLLLLGEPGSGKSVALHQEEQATRMLVSPDDEVLIVDLGEAQDARELREKIFAAPPVVSSRERAGRLHLFLDSLDEAKVQIRRVVSLLENGLEDLALGRVVLRITCRTAERPVEFETWLSRAFGSDRHRTLELAPLRLSETMSTASALGVDADRFVASALVAGAGPLAARPLTLKMLLRVLAAEGEFPDALARLYESALLFMAGEHDPERRDLRTLSASESIAIAARIAAATILAGRDVIGDGVAGAVELTQLIGGTELDRLIAQPTEVTVNEQAVREVLGTALFSARGGGLGWAHRTFGEYLAAFWLAGERISDQQVADLLLVDEGTARRITPPLRNVAGWLLTLRSGFQRSLVPADAVVMVYGDPSSVAPEIRRQLFPALLEAIADHEVERFGLRSLWPRLAYDGIARELQTALGNTALDDQARQAAVDAVAQLGIRKLVPALVDIALNPVESIALRTSVLYALKTLSPYVTLDRLRPLTMQPQPADIDDEIKGGALRVCWPDAMTADELFASLTPEKNERLLGAYKIFLTGECAPHLQSARDLLAGVRWALTVPRDWDSTRSITTLADVVVARAWPLAANEPEIAEALADLVALVKERLMPVLASARSLRSEDALESALDDGAANEAITEVLVGRVAAGGFPVELLSRAMLSELAYGVDIHRMIDRWSTAAPGPEREAWRAVILTVARGPGGDVLFELKDLYPDLYQYVAARYEAVRIDSPEAEAMREEWRAEQEALRLPDVDSSEFDQHVIAELDVFRNGDLNGYWRMQYWLMIDDEGFIEGREFRDDLTETAGWRRVPEEVREDIADNAAIYLRQMDPDPDRWIGTNTVYWPAWAGYCALKLMWKERRAAFEKLEPAVWRRWAPIVVAWPNLGTEEEGSEFRNAALTIVREIAPDVATSTVLKSFGTRLTRTDIRSFRNRLGPLWDSNVVEALFAQLRRTDISEQQMVDVVNELIEAGRAEALAWARDRVSVGAICDADRRDATLRIAAILARHAPAIAWEVLETAAAASDEAGRLLLTSLLDRSESGWFRDLTPCELGRLYALVHRFFPPAPDSAQERSGAMTPAMMASFCRSRILEVLVSAGTAEAVAVITALEEEFDQYGWIRGIRHRAQEQLRRLAWRPPHPADIVRMGGVDARRYVPDAVTLRTVVLDALAGMEKQRERDQQRTRSMVARTHRRPQGRHQSRGRGERGRADRRRSDGSPHPGDFDVRRALERGYRG